MKNACLGKRRLPGQLGSSSEKLKGLELFDGRPTTGVFLQSGAN
jgi:hypothetical protein